MQTHARTEAKCRQRSEASILFGRVWKPSEIRVRVSGIRALFNITSSNITPSACRTELYVLPPSILNAITTENGHTIFKQREYNKKIRARVLGIVGLRALFNITSSNITPFALRTECYVFSPFKNSVSILNGDCIENGYTISKQREYNKKLGLGFQELSGYEHSLISHLLPSKSNFMYSTTKKMFNLRKKDNRECGILYGGVQHLQEEKFWNSKLELLAIKISEIHI